MEERLAAEHCSEKFCHALKHFLDCSGVPQESYCHLQALWWDVADSCLDVVRDPLNKVGAVLVLHVEHLLINLLGGHAATEQCRSCEVAAVTRVRSTHHVLRIEHLLSQ